MLSTPTTHNPPPPRARGYSAHGASADMWRSKAIEIVISGPAGTGKSRACLEKLHFCALKYAGMRGLIIRKTRESLSEAALVTFEDKVLPSGDPLKDGPRRNFRQVYHYPNKSAIVVGGLDKPGKIMSTEYDMIYVQEATELDLAAWLALTTRLRNGVMPYQQLLADCNPDAPTHWLWIRAQSGTTTMLHSRHEDNPRLYRNGQWTAEGRAYKEKLERLGHIDAKTGERVGTEYQRLGLGLWVQATGVIFGVWSDGPSDGNVTTAAEFEAGAGEVLWFVDDGYVGVRDAQTGQWTADSHPRVFLLAQVRHDGTINVFDESDEAGLLSDVHVADVLALPYPHPDYAVVDKSAAELKGRLHAAGVYTRNSPSDVEESIKELRRALALDQNGRRRVNVHPRCANLRAEMPSYRKDANGKIIKAFDHSIDALRYGVWSQRFEQ
jgi:phage terminase large subunit